MKIGDQVEGILFKTGTVVALGTAQELCTPSFDPSFAMAEAIREEWVLPTEPSVAVRTENGIGAYIADEVWKA